jgi:hypothetical protein
MSSSKANLLSELMLLRLVIVMDCMCRIAVVIMSIDAYALRPPIISCAKLHKEHKSADNRMVTTRLHLSLKFHH